MCIPFFWPNGATTCFDLCFLLSDKHFFYYQYYFSYIYTGGGLIWFLVFNASFNNISAISWWSVLLVEETGVPRENH